MKVGIITIENLEDRKAWSGIIYHTYQELCDRYGRENVIHIPTKAGRLEKIYLLFYKFIARLCGKRITNLDRFVSVCRARSVRRDLINKVDLLFAPAASVDISALEIDTPIIYMGDATFNLLNGYYTPSDSYFTNKIKEAFEVEKQALEKASFCFFASHWAIESAIKDYHLPVDKTAFVPFGANLKGKDIVNNKDSRYVNICKKTGGVNILFVGVSWERKGGQEAFECVCALNRIGIDATLYMVGLRNIPEKCKNSTYVKNYGFLDKNDENDYQTLVALYKKCDIFLLPTKAECAGIVFAEASAFGLPILTYDTGGVGDYVLNGVNGYRLSLSCTGEDFAYKIDQIMQKGEFETLAEGGRKLYADYLNWKYWGVCFDKVYCKLKTNGSIYAHFE